MKDFFELLGQPRLPWLDPERLKQSYLQLSATIHPDKANVSDPSHIEANAQFGEINQAYQCLKETRTRLRHFLELTVARPIQDLSEVPPRLIELFQQSHKLFKEIDFALMDANTESPLLKAVNMKRNAALLNRIQVFQSALNALQTEVEGHLKEANAFWSDPISHSAEALDQALMKIEEWYRTAGYLAKWRTQLLEKQFRLTF